MHFGALEISNVDHTANFEEPQNVSKTYYDTLHHFGHFDAGNVVTAFAFEAKKTSDHNIYVKICKRN